MNAVTISEARAHLPAILDRVEAGEEVTITRHGRPVGVVVAPAALRHRRLETALPTMQRVREVLNAARLAPIPAEGLSDEWAEELVSEIRAGRDGG